MHEMRRELVSESCAVEVGSRSSRLAELTEWAMARFWPVGAALCDGLTPVIQAAHTRYAQQVTDAQVFSGLAEEVARQLETFTSSFQQILQSFESVEGKAAGIPARMLLHSIRNSVGLVYIFLETVSMLDERDPNPRKALDSIARSLSSPRIFERAGLQPHRFVDAIVASGLVAEGAPPSLAPHIDLRDLIAHLFVSRRSLVGDAQRLTYVSRIADRAHQHSLPHPFIVTEVLGESMANAMRAMSSTGGTVGVSVSCSSRQEWTFVVTDTGPGLSPRDFALLEAGALKSSKAGGGQGLLLNRKAIEDIAGGKFQLRNVPGRGFAVRFTIPPVPSE